MASIFKKIEMQVSLETDEVRALMLQLSVKDQLAMLAAMVNRFDREQFVSLAPSEQMLLKMWLKNMINTIEGNIT